MARKPKTKTEEKPEKTVTPRKKSIVPRKTAGKPVRKPAAKSPESGGKPPKTAGKSAVKTKSTPKKKNPKVTRPTPQEEAEILQRRNLVFDLRKAGASIRQISELLQSRGIKGASVGQVQADWSYMLDLQYETERLSVEQYIEYEISVVNEVQFAFYPDMKKRPKNGEEIIDDDNHETKKRTRSRGSFDGDPTRREAGEMVLSCVRERAKLRNLYKPTKVNLNVDDELAKLLGIDPKELPDVDAAEN